MNTVAIVIPAFNEEITLKKTIIDYHTYLPDAAIYVIDNNSTDSTNEIAKSTIEGLSCDGSVFFEKRQGKANAIRKAFSEIDADIYVMVDADLTYPAKEIKKLIAPVINGKADMVVGDRHTTGSYKKENKKELHNLGNWLVRILVNMLFKAKLNDIMSGCRIFSKNFVNNYPIMSTGFELETEMTIHALDKRFNIIEIPIEYKDRQGGSISKLNTIKDGAEVIKTIFLLLKDYRPFLFFGLIALVLGVMGLVIGFPVIMEFIRMRYIYKVPSAILATGLLILSLLSLSTAFILDTVSKINKYNYELNLLSKHRKYHKNTAESLD